MEQRYRPRPMRGLELEPFADDHVEAAAALLAQRHERHRLTEPLLPEAPDFRAELEKEWRAEGASGIVALDGDTLVGYLIGHPREDKVGPNMWTYIAGHAVREPELTRDLYAAAAANWVEAGMTRHFVYVPALDDLVDPWFRLSFGASAALAARETAAEPAEPTTILVREGTAGDIEAAVSLDRAMGESMLPAPSFSLHPPDPVEEAMAEWHGTWDDTETFRHFVAEREGRVVGHALLYRRPPDLRVPVDAIDLAQASTEPAERGAGVGLALTRHVLAWAHQHGFPTMVTDWRMTNLLASRFWPARGFRTSFLRLYRSIP
jgi:GNAT superfamily N-acetyltransferase